MTSAHSPAVINGSHATAARPRIIPRYPGMETSDSQRTIVSSTTVTVTAGPRQRPPNMAIDATSQGDQGQQPPQAASAHMTRQRWRLPGRPPSSSGRARHGGLPARPCRRRRILAGRQFHDVHLTQWPLRRTVSLVGSLSRARTSGLSQASLLMGLLRRSG